MPRSRPGSRARSSARTLGWATPKRPNTRRAPRRPRPPPSRAGRPAGSGVAAAARIDAARSCQLLHGRPGTRPGQHHRVGGAPAHEDGIADPVALAAAWNDNLQRHARVGANDVAHGRAEIRALLDLALEVGRLVGDGVGVVTGELDGLGADRKVHLVTG